ncbi:MAG: family 16 glycosylhydrolase [Anaerolineales bacterium]
MAYTKLTPRFTPGASVEEIPNDSLYRLMIPAGKADQYRLAQLDDYTKIPRRRFPLRLPLSLSLSARTSSDSIAGTWGFGLWNDPFGLSLGFGGDPFRLPALPNAVWFFGASRESYLSFRSSGRENPAPTFAANGFIAQAFRAPKFHPLLILAGLVLPFSRKLTRRILGKVIEEDGVNLWNVEARSHENQHQAVVLQSQSVDPTQWHRYRLDWSEEQVVFYVDEKLVFESRVSPRPPLGLVIWLDNQYAAFTPQGKIGFGVLENPEPAWLEIKELQIG